MTGTSEPTGSDALSALLHEERSFPPTADLTARANARPGIYEQAAADPLAWWAEQAERLTWDYHWDHVLDWDLPYAKWFVGGRLNAAYNCVDRHVEAGLGDRVAYYWIGEPEGDSRIITYADLQRMVCQAANALLELGVKAGDRVAIYLPMIPEAVVAMLACARLGAPHSVIFGGFSAEALASRILDADARVVITADGGFRRGAASALKPHLDKALEQCPDVRRVVVVQRTGGVVDWTEGRDVWWHELVERQPDTHEADSFDAEQPLYIMYTSGTTAKPKGILHSTGGYLVHTAATHRLVFDVKPEEDVFWTAADIGWVTGHSYIVYGPLANGDDLGHVRGHARRRRQGPLVADRRGLQGVDPLHRADHHPHPHEVGARVPGRPRPLEPPAARLGGRAHQPRGLDVVPPAHRGRAVPDRRHLVADRDRGDPHHAATRHDGHQAGGRHAPVPGGRGRRGRQRRAGRWATGEGGYLVLTDPGPGCFAASGAIPSAIARPTGRASPAATSPETGQSATRTAICGCSAASTT